MGLILAGCCLGLAIGWARWGGPARARESQRQAQEEAKGFWNCPTPDGFKPLGDNQGDYGWLSRPGGLLPPADRRQRR